MHRFNKQMIVLQIKKSKEMKKLVLMFVAIAAISFASCNGNSKPAQNADSTADSTVDSAMVDSANADSAAADSVAPDSVK